MNMVPRGYIGRTKGLIHVYKNVSRYSVARKHGPRGGVVVTDSVADSVSGPHRSIGSIESAKGVVVSEKKEKDQSVRFGFSAGGLLFPFYIGVVKGLTTAGYMSERTKLAGASAGSLIAACE
jgi:predicted acylesterase/phospholipase RssA